MTGPKLEPENQNQNQEQNQNQNPNFSETLETQTQNTPVPNTKTYSEEEYNNTVRSTHNLYGEALKEAEQKRLALESQLAEARRNVQQTSQVPDDELTPAQLIERAVKVQVAPLLDEFSMFRQNQQQNQYQVIKNNFFSLPQFAQFRQFLEPNLDTEMQGKAISVEAVQDALAKIIGRVQMQAVMNPQNNNQNQNQQQMNNNQQQQPQNNRQQNLPAHLRSSAPPQPNQNGNQNLTPGGNQRYQLTELQARIARENKLNHDQYIDWISESPTNVVHSQIGVPPKQN